jgi:putative ABC transport system permease protein
LNIFDDMIFQIGIDDGRDLLAMGNSAQQIIIMLNDYRKADIVAGRIRALIPDTSISVTPWTRIGDTYTTAVIVQKIYGWIYVIIALLGAFIISNIMMMVVMERRREIGILKAMGFTKREVLVMFLSEGMILGLIGSLIGTTLGTGLCVFFHYHGIDLSAYMTRMSIPLDNVLYTTASASSLIISVILGTTLAALVSLAPSRQAAGMNVVDAIKSV